MRQETIIEPDRRFITVAAYQRQTGLSYPTVMAAIKRGEIRAIQTESGHYRIDTQPPGTLDAAVTARLDSIEKKLSALVKQFRTDVV